MYADSLFNAFARSFEVRSETDMSMAEYLESCRGDPMRYANAAERLLAAIGEPQMIDTAKDARLGRIFLNRTMRAYPAFAGFYGMEETIERIVGFFGTQLKVWKSASRFSICWGRWAVENRRWRSG
jgi:serine protein kinase